VEQRVQHAGPVTHAVQDGIGQPGAQQQPQDGPVRSRQRTSHRLHHVARDRRDVDRQPFAVEPLERLRDARHRAAAHRHRAVTGLSVDRHAHRAHLLLGHLDRVQAPPGEV
jgi:hypothetical protein